MTPSSPETPPPTKGTSTEAGPAPSAELIAWLESQPEPHILFDGDYRIAAANAAYRKRFAPRGTVIGRTCYAVSHRFSAPCDQSGESCPLAKARATGQRQRVLHLHHTPQGEAYVDIELTPVRAAGGDHTWFVEKMETLRTARGAPASQGLIGRSDAFRTMLALVSRVGPSEASVLLLGESGTGKELVARAVHEASARASRPMVVVDCASLPESLFESELFGHERGAFTGAHAARAGLVETADGGTLFLDEVGDIPLTMQVKLLRLLESGTYRRVGSSDLRRADLRIVSATHRDLSAMVDAGRFREDLLYRLGTFPILLPPLRDRPTDIPLLAESLLDRVAPGRGLTLTGDALERLSEHPFPGNVRELRNVLERASLLTDGPTVTGQTIEQALSMGCRARAGAPARAASVGPSAAGAHPAQSAATSGATLRDAEHEALRRALAEHRGNRKELARTLGISLRTLYRKLRAIDDGA